MLRLNVLLFEGLVREVLYKLEDVSPVGVMTVLQALMAVQQQQHRLRAVQGRGEGPGGRAAQQQQQQIQQKQVQLQQVAQLQFVEQQTSGSTEEHLLPLLKDSPDRYKSKQQQQHWQQGHGSVGLTSCRTGSSFHASSLHPSATYSLSSDLHLDARAAGAGGVVKGREGVGARSSSRGLADAARSSRGVQQPAAWVDYNEGRYSSSSSSERRGVEARSSSSSGGKTAMTHTTCNTQGRVVDTEGQGALAVYAAAGAAASAAGGGNGSAAAAAAVARAGSTGVKGRRLQDMPAVSLNHIQQKQQQLLLARRGSKRKDKSQQGKHHYHHQQQQQGKHHHRQQQQQQTAQPSSSRIASICRLLSQQALARLPETKPQTLASILIALAELPGGGEGKVFAAAESVLGPVVTSEAGPDDAPAAHWGGSARGIELRPGATGGGGGVEKLPMLKQYQLLRAFLKVNHPCLWLWRAVLQQQELWLGRRKIITTESTTASRSSGSAEAGQVLRQQHQQQHQQQQDEWGQVEGGLLQQLSYQELLLLVVAAAEAGVWREGPSTWSVLLHIGEQLLLQGVEQRGWRELLPAVWAVAKVCWGVSAQQQQLQQQQQEEEEEEEGKEFEQQLLHNQHQEMGQLLQQGQNCNLPSKQRQQQQLLHVQSGRWDQGLRGFNAGGYGPGEGVVGKAVHDVARLEGRQDGLEKQLQRMKISLGPLVSGMVNAVLRGARTGDLVTPSHLSLLLEAVVCTQVDVALAPAAFPASPSSDLLGAGPRTACSSWSITSSNVLLRGLEAANRPKTGRRFSISLDQVLQLSQLCVDCLGGFEAGDVVRVLRCHYAHPQLRGEKQVIALLEEEVLLQKLPAPCVEELLANGGAATRRRKRG
jgi:hypothetical protein